VAIESGVMSSAGPSMETTWYKCIDGDLATRCSTGSQLRPFAILYFSETELHHVTVASRQDCCQAGLGNFTVWFELQGSWRKCGDAYSKVAEYITVVCEGLPPTTGVAIVKDGTGILSLADVFVYAASASPPPALPPQPRAPPPTVTWPHPPAKPPMSPLPPAAPSVRRIPITLADPFNALSSQNASGQHSWERCVDGDPATRCETEVQSMPPSLALFFKQAMLARVEVQTPADCCAELLGDFSLWFSSQAGWARCGRHTAPAVGEGRGATISVDCEGEPLASGVAIVKDGPGVLSLAEVRLFGYT